MRVKTIILSFYVDVLFWQREKYYAPLLLGWPSVGLITGIYDRD